MILEDEHLQDVTVEQIVERAGVSVGTFYRRIGALLPLEAVEDEVEG